jgi:arsenate reductase-like glutaredoxin family protein
MRPTIKISDLSTGEVIERELNDEEYAQWLKQTEESQQKMVLKNEQAQQRLALLERLGITEQEAKLLLS